MVAKKERISVRVPENIIRLSGESSHLFFEALENPPDPNARLLAAARAHQALLNASD